MTQTGEPLPLAGVRVIDMTSTIAGPTATRHMADFGAEVIKIESMSRPDIARMGPPFGAGPDKLNNSGYFAAYNAGKLSMSLDLNKPAALDVLRRLIEVSDVLVEAFRPGVMARWGLTYDRVKSWNPTIIMASHSLQGQTGPMAAHRGFGHLAAAATGWFDITGTQGQEPTGPYSAYTDFVAWPVLLSAILLALEDRDVTGEGAYIDHSHIESSAYFAAPELLRAQQGDAPQRDGNHDDYASPNNVYPCLGPDRWCAITVCGDAQWQAFCEVLDPSGGLGAQQDFVTHATRKINETGLDRAIAALTRDRDATELADRLLDRGIAAGPVYRAQDLFCDPQLDHRATFRRVHHETHGPHAVLAPAFRIEGLAAGPARPFPSLGEHTAFVCKSVLGMAEAEIADLTGQGVFA